MKKALFVLLLLPFIALSQSTIATWNTTSTTSGTVASNQYLNTSVIAAQGISSNPGQWNGFQTTGWTSQGNFETNKYVYFSISALPNNTVTVSSLEFAYSGTAKKQKVQYILDGTALTANETTTTDDQAEDWASKSYSKSLAITIPSGKTLVIRISAAQGNSRNIGNITVKGSSTTPAAYTGTYHIGAAQPFPFNTITNAVNAINTYGVSGNVTYLLDDALYNNNKGEIFPIVLNKIGGSSNNTSSSKTITIKPAPGVNTVIEANNGFANNNIVYVPAAFILKSADYITFDGSNTNGGTTKNLTIVNNNTEYSSGRRAVIWVADNANDAATNNTVKNTILKNGNNNAGSALTAGIYSGNYSLGGTQNAHINYVDSAVNNSNLTVTNNTFSNVKQGVVVNGGTGAATATNIFVNKNDMGAYATSNTARLITGVYFNNVNTFEVKENSIHDIYRDNTENDDINNTYTYSAGIYVAGASKNGSVTRNNIKDVVRTSGNSYLLAGINLESTEASANVLVANNFVVGVKSNGGDASEQDSQGIAIAKGGDYKIYFNTVNMTGSQSGGGYSSAFYVGAGAGTSLDVRNNIFVNNQTSTNTRRTAVRIVKSSTSAFTYLDYNNLYAPYVGYLGTSPNTGDNVGYQTSKSGWKSATGKEVNMVDVQPAFVSATDLHLAANSAVNATLAATVVSVTTDIDGQTRNFAAPTIGADEYGVNPYTNTVTCENTTIWDGAAWTNGVPTATTNAIFKANYTQNGGTLNACSVFVLNGATVNFINNSTARVVHSVNVEETAALSFESSSVLFQIEDDANTGIVTVERYSGNLKRLDYTIWSAPVLDSRTTGFQTLQQFSPQTAAGRYFTYNTTQSLFTTVDQNSKFAQGAGYLIRMPNTDNTPGYNTSGTRITFRGVFTGTPNNGTIVKPLDATGFGYNIVGNPYPSPISVKAFINANIDNIDGTVWLWRKTNDATQASYCTVNLSGYTANAAHINAGNDLILDPYSIDADGSLNTAQGFFVKTTAPNKQLVFNNSMRLDNHSNTFFRTAAQESTEEVSRLWLNVTNAAGDFDQVLLAYNAQSTTGFDKGYDGKALSSANISLYSTLAVDGQTMKLAIQARGAFTATDVVPMGFTATAAGTYTVNIDHSEGVFAAGQIVYLTDNVEGITRNITERSYTFTTAAGTFADRFTVTYAQAALGTDNPIAATTDVIVYKDNKQVAVTAPQAIKSVVVYDMLGRSLYNNAKVNSNEFKTSDINAAQQVVVVLVTLENSQVITKKIMMN